MCLLTFYPEGTKADREALEYGALHNPDGHGYAIIVGDDLIVRRSMDPDRLITEFVNVRQAHPEGPAMFHSRIGTGGNVDKSNCHPFPVGDDPLTVVAHNGILPQEVWPRKNDPRSDTRIFAQHHLPRRNLNGHRSMRKLASWVRSDKLVILTVNPAYSWRYRIINEHYGQWDTTGIWYSNDSYLPARYVAQTYGTYVSSGWSTKGTVKSPLYAPSGVYDGFYILCESVRIGRHFHYIVGADTRCDPDCTILYTHHIGDSPLLDLGASIPTQLPDTCLPVQHDWTEVSSDDDDWPTTLGTTLATRQLNSACTVCGALGSVSAVTVICTACLTCNECLGSTDPNRSDDDAPCLCYVPSWAERDPGNDLDAELIRQAQQVIFGTGTEPGTGGM